MVCATSRAAAGQGSRGALALWWFGLYGSVSAFEFSLFAAPTSKNSATDELSADTFATHLKEHPVTAVLFYAPWCFYSQQVMPAWDLASQKLQIHDPPVKLARIDTHRHGSIGEQYGVNSYPTMKLFVDGAIFDFDSRQGRGWQQIVKWVNTHIDRDHVLKDVEDAEKFLHDNDLNVIGLLPDGHDEVFVKSTRHFEDVMFAEARGTEVANNVASYISKHASLLCETVSLGMSKENVMSVTLSRPSMHCEDAPKNPQRPDWTDKFSTNVEGTKLTVHRSDSTSGWDQHLQIKCCDAETEASTKLSIPIPSVIMFFPHDERFAVYDGDLNDVHRLDRWIQARRTPMIMRFTEQTAETIFESGPEKAPILFLISNTHQPETELVLTEAGKELRGRIVFCISGSRDRMEKRLMDLAGAEEDQLPILTLVEAHVNGGEAYHTARKYRIELKGLTVQKVVKFVEDYEGSKLTPWMRSEPEPTKEDISGPVGILVGTTFTKVAHDKTKDVLVDFYAPWCGHCRKFEPVYKELAKKVRHVKSLKITKLDATRNEVEGLRINAFPTIILFPAGDKPQVFYEGSRQPEDMIRWLHQHCQTPFVDTAPPEHVEESVESGLLTEAEEDL